MMKNINWNDCCENLNLPNYTGTTLANRFFKKLLESNGTDQLILPFNNYKEIEICDYYKIEVSKHYKENLFDGNFIDISKIFNKEWKFNSFKDIYRDLFNKIWVLANKITGASYGDFVLPTNNLYKEFIRSTNRFINEKLNDILLSNQNLDVTLKIISHDFGNYIALTKNDINFDYWFFKLINQWKICFTVILKDKKISFNYYHYF